MARPGKYKPGKKKLLVQTPLFSEKEYRERLKKGKPLPQGARVRFKKPKPLSAEALGIVFRADGTVEIPRYAGSEGALHVVGTLHAKTAPDAVRLVQHQLDSVKSSVDSARIVIDTVARLHADLEYRWKGFDGPTQKAFIEYSSGVIGLLAKNPELLKEEQKIHACYRLGRAAELLQQGNGTAAETTLASIQRNMHNWLRKLEPQFKNLQRRKAAVVDKYFFKQTRIWGAVDSLINIFGRLSSTRADKRALASMLLGARDNLFRTGLQAFKQPAKVIESAARYVEKGDIEKAKKAIKKANQLILLAASPISSIYPEKLRLIIKSTEPELDKQAILANQAVLFHDMLNDWWRPRNAQKSALMLETITELSRLAENIGRSDAARLIASARSELEQNRLSLSIDSFARAAVSLKPGLAKEML